MHCDKEGREGENVEKRGRERRKIEARESKREKMGRRWKEKKQRCYRALTGAKSASHRPVRFGWKVGSTSGSLSSFSNVHRRAFV